MWVERARVVARFAVAELGAFALWAFVVNRVVLNWTDGRMKTATLAALAVALGTLAAISAVGPLARRGVFWAWPGLLGLFSLGEAHRVWLRHAYGGTPYDAPLYDPVTTTDLVVRRFSLELASFGATPTRIVALSDLHVTESTDATYAARVHSAVRALDPDLVFVMGDTISKPERLPLLAHWLEGLPHGRRGSYAVLGNHDVWTGRAEEIADTLRNAGFVLVGGRCTDVTVADARRVRVCGSEAPWGPALDAPLERADSAATLVLSHTPDNVYELAERGATAVFAGHTHGGQWRLPGFGALVIPSRYGRRFDQGRFHVDGTELFVSTGVGADAPNLRLWCPPDVVVVELVGRSP